MDSQAAINILMFTYGMTQEKASELIPNNPNQNTNE